VKNVIQKATANRFGWWEAVPFKQAMHHPGLGRALKLQILTKTAR
jgi:hypothetical protein